MASLPAPIAGVPDVGDSNSVAAGSLASAAPLSANAGVWTSVNGVEIYAKINPGKPRPAADVLGPDNYPPGMPRGPWLSLVAAKSELGAHTARLDTDGGGFAFKQTSRAYQGTGKRGQTVSLLCSAAGAPRVTEPGPSPRASMSTCSSCPWGLVLKHCGEGWVVSKWHGRKTSEAPEHNHSLATNRPASNAQAALRGIPHELDLNAEIMSRAYFSAQDINKAMTSHAASLGYEVTWNYQDIFNKLSLT
ncbi:hypothetical protein M885DRAFT_195974 [Pelagophyceae sp. CCMP2097]|nr:hypothetical protein M885DRAFT_195974 [Pelagophyceae sp. CCMP2097]